MTIDSGSSHVPCDVDNRRPVRYKPGDVGPRLEVLCVACQVLVTDDSGRLARVAEQVVVVGGDDLLKAGAGYEAMHVVRDDVLGVDLDPVQVLTRAGPEDLGGGRVELVPPYTRRVLYQLGCCNEIPALDVPPDQRPVLGAVDLVLHRNRLDERVPVWEPRPHRHSRAHERVAPAVDE
jgi:hypothetical protein